MFHGQRYPFQAKPDDCEINKRLTHPILLHLNVSVQFTPPSRAPPPLKLMLVFGKMCETLLTSEERFSLFNSTLKK